MIGIPCDLGAANTVEDVFGDNLLPSQYANSWIVFCRDEATDNYLPLTLSSGLEQGRGYWLYSMDWGVWDASGTLTSYVVSGLCISPDGCFEVTLTAPDVSTTRRWNLVGHPANQTVDRSSAAVLVDSTRYRPFTAQAAGYVSKTIYKYNGSAYDSYDDGTPGMEGTLESQEGIWVELLGDSSGHTVKLLIPSKQTLGGSPGPPGRLSEVEGEGTPQAGTVPADLKAGPPTRVDEWYVRLIAESPAEGLADTRNVLGQLLDSSEGYDLRDLPEMAPFSSPYLTIVFPHDDWGDHAGDYASDYHPPGWREADEWVFQVRTDNPWRDVRLAWAPVRMLQSTVSHDNCQRQWTTHRTASGEPLMAKMWLEDVDTGELIKVAEDGVPQDHWFNMNGQTVRTFRWILKGKGGNEAPPSERDMSRDLEVTADTLGLPPSSIEHPPRPGLDD